MHIKIPFIGTFQLWTEYDWYWDSRWKARNLVSVKGPFDALMRPGLREGFRETYKTFETDSEYEWFTKSPTTDTVTPESTKDGKGPQA